MTTHIHVDGRKIYGLIIEEHTSHVCISSYDEAKATGAVKKAVTFGKTCTARLGRPAAACSRSLIWYRPVLSALRRYSAPHSCFRPLSHFCTHSFLTRDYLTLAFLHEA